MSDNEALSGRRSALQTLGLSRRQTRIQVEFLDIGGVRLRVGVRRGRGRPLLLFNGIGANLDMSMPLIRALDDVEIVVFDMPGTGGSPTRLRPRRFAALARLSVALLDRLGYDEPLNVAGVSWGGALAQQFALDYPQRTNRLILAATAAGMFGLSVRGNLLKRLTTARRYRRNQTLADIAPALYGGLIRRRPELLERRGAYANGPTTRGYLNQMLGGLGWVSVHRLHAVRCPTLIMGGDDDPVMPLVNVRLLYWLIPKSYLHIVRGGGHLFLMLRANESAAVIKRFVHERRYDGTDEQDFFAARGLPPDGQITPPTPDAARAADARLVPPWPVGG